MNPKDKISAYILCSAASALLFLCVVGALSSATNLTNHPPKFPIPQNKTAFGVNGHENTSSVRRKQTLTFADRVAYQRATEEVYWRHSIWPPANATAKPLLDKVMSQAHIEEKVEDYLRNSQALEDYWQRPITPDQLQAEMERMASHTKQPGVLRELFAALGNDPFVIAECLARPVLAERVITELYAHDQRFHGELKRRAKTELRAHASVSEMKQTSGMYTEIEWIKSEEAKDGSAPTDTKSAEAVRMNEREWQDGIQKLAKDFGVGARSRRRGIVAFKSADISAHSKKGATDQSEILPVGRLSPLQEDDAHYYAVAVTNKGKDRLELATIAWLKEPLQSWVAKAETQVPVTMAAVRANYALPVIASPSGGCTDDSWTTTITTSAPAGRASHTAVWTGSEMIVWGGANGSSFFNTGGRYNPGTDSWTVTNTTGAPVGRYLHTAVWTGSEMIVWGGFDGINFLNTGGRYNPSTDNWTATNTTGVPAGRYLHTAAWTGSEMIVWGGFDGINFLNTGGRYNPSTDSWTATNTTGAPAGRENHTAVWTSNEMIVWGGLVSGNVFLNTGGRYNPGTDSWTVTNTTGAPAGRYLHTAVWTGSEMIVWGGDNGSFLNTGGRYNPGTDSWTATITTGAPAARENHTAVWTSNEIIVWGGDNGSFLNTGGRYNPGTDSWTTTITTGAPAARYAHTAVWTGGEMIVWGGANGPSYFDTGGRYCARTSTPTPTPTPTGTPTPNGLQVSLIRCSSVDVYSNSGGGVDEPLIPQPNAAILISQPVTSRGVVADGVTPLVFKIHQNVAAQASYYVTIDQGLTPHVHILNGSVWSNSPIITFNGTNTTGFAYMDGLTPEAVFGTGQTQLARTLTLTNTQVPTDVTTKVFNIRRPPIFLVHGYHADRSTWSDEFLNALSAATFYLPNDPDSPDSFIRRLNYGQANNHNVWGTFPFLARELDAQLPGEENVLHKNWAFTRYDVVGHSQGGVLTRMLCAQNATPITLKFKGPENFNRGRFRRVITIGSPHNGSTLVYYLSGLRSHGLYGIIPRILGDYLQPKFDPFGIQIHWINDSSAAVDPDAKFRLITATIDGGDVPPLPLPLCYSLIGLNRLSIHEIGSTRGEIVLRNGSDGVVDIQSQRAGIGTPISQMEGDICHALSGLEALALFGTSSSETHEAQVGSTAATLLTGSMGNFGAFRLPANLDDNRRTEIEAEIPFSLILDLIRPFGVPRTAPTGSVSYAFAFTPDPSEPFDGVANWYAEVFGPNGLSTEGLTVTPNPSDPTHVTVEVEASVQGDVVVYLSYNSTTGHLVVGRPVLVVSIPPGANLTGIELRPSDIAATVGDVIGLQVWGMYDNSTTSQLFVSPETTTFSSSNPSVATVESSGRLTAARPGDAIVTGSYGGFNAVATVHVDPAPRLAPTPRPHAIPSARPTPPPHLTPVPPPPSPRPTAWPRPTPPPHITPIPTPSSPRPTPPPRP